MQGYDRAINQNQMDNIEAEVTEIEQHLHNHEKWFGAANEANGEIHVADRINGAILPFALVSGASDWGSWVQVLGSEDTPVTPGMTKYDLHRMLVTTTDSTAPFSIQVVTGESSGIAAKLIAEDFDEFPYIAGTNNNDSGIGEILDEKHNTGLKVWMRCACVGQVGKTFNFYLGLHEYLV